MGRGVDRLGEAREAVGADKQDVAHTAVLEVGHDACPEARALAFFGPQAEAFALACERDADRDVHGAFLDDLLFADRDHQGVQVDDDVDLLERPALPRPHVVLDRGGDLADQPLADIDAVELAEVALDVARRHPARIERQDLIVEAIEAPRVLGHDPRLERRVAVPRQLDRERPIDRAQRLARPTVTPIGLLPGRLLTRRIAEMLTQLHTRSALDQPPPQPVDQPLRARQLTGLLYPASS